MTISIRGLMLVVHCTYFVPKIVHGITYIFLQVVWYIFSYIPFKVRVLIHNVKHLASVIPTKPRNNVILRTLLKKKRRKQN